MIWAVDCHLRRENRSYINNVTKFMREPRTNGTPGSYHMVQVSYCINSKNMAIWLHVLYKNLGVYDVGGGTWRTCRDWSCCRTRSWCTTNSCLIIASSIKSPKLWNVGPTTSRQSTASSKSNAPFMKTTKWALSLSPSLPLLVLYDLTLPIGTSNFWAFLDELNRLPLCFKLVCTIIALKKNCKIIQPPHVNSLSIEFCVHRVFTYMARPRVKSHMGSAGSRPSYASFTVQSFCPQLEGNSSSFGINVTMPSQNYKFSSWHHFHYSQLIDGVTYMSKELNGLSDWVLWHWFPMGKSSHACLGRKTVQWRWRGEERAPAERRRDLAQGHGKAYEERCVKFNNRSHLDASHNASQILRIGLHHGPWTIVFFHD